MGIDIKTIGDTNLKNLLLKSYEIINARGDLFGEQFNRLYYAKEKAREGLGKGIRFSSAGKVNEQRVGTSRKYRSMADILILIHLSLWMVSVLGALFFDQLVQNDLGIFPKPLIKTNPWLRFHASDIFSGYLWPANLYSILTLWNEQRLSFKGKLLAAFLATCLILIGSIVLEIIIQKDMVDFLVELPGIFIFILVNSLRIYFEHHAQLPKDDYNAMSGSANLIEAATSL